MGSMIQGIFPRLQPAARGEPEEQPGGFPTVLMAPRPRKHDGSRRGWPWWAERLKEGRNAGRDQRNGGISDSRDIPTVAARRWGRAGRTTGWISHGCNGSQPPKMRQE